MIQTYLDQTTCLATSAGVEFKRAVLHAGISDAQYYRWAKRSTTMSESSARRICRSIKQLAARAAKRGSNHVHAAAG